MHACLSFNENKNVQEYTCMINELQATSLLPFFWPATVKPNYSQQAYNEFTLTAKFIILLNYYNCIMIIYL